MFKTKEVEIRDEKYVIQRWPAEIGLEGNKALKSGDKFMVVYLGTVSPKYATVEDVKQDDWEVVDHLWIEIAEFNTMEPAFLSRLRNLPLPGQPRSGTQESTEKSTNS